MGVVEVPALLVEQEVEVGPMVKTKEVYEWVQDQDQGLVKVNRVYVILQDKRLEELEGVQVEVFEIPMCVTIRITSTITITTTMVPDGSHDKFLEH